MQQSLPQSPAHLAMASYHHHTTCGDVRTPKKHPTSYGERISLEFVDVDTPEAWIQEYHTCTDSIWDRSRGAFKGTEEVGHLDTFVFWYNPCDTHESITVNVTRLPVGMLPTPLITACS